MEEIYLVTIGPDKRMFQEQIAKVPKGVPVVMLNLLKFRGKADYPDRKISSTGIEAYNLYSKKVYNCVKNAGARVVWYAKASLIAPKEGEWDRILLVRYPSIEKFVEMVSDKEYIGISKHMTAALEDSRLIATLQVNEGQ